ncbi:MAG: DUF4118 domain-containing protein [Oscillospiraceae bacterium]|nr:DUF4118 domain-containing protein [Oscillospiraceae bacterium]
MAEQKNNMQRGNLRGVFVMAAIFLAASGIGHILGKFGFPETNIAVVYLLAVLMTAWLAKSFVFGFIASILATFLFNFFFAEPIFTFAVNDPHYVITFIIMTVTALITSTLTSHAQRGAAEAKKKEAETKAIFNLTNHLTDAKGMHEIAKIAVSAISECFLCEAACLCFDDDNMPENFFVQQISGGGQAQREVADADELKHRIEGLRTGFDVGAEFTDWPVYGSESTLGLIRIPNDRAKTMNEEQMRLLRSMIESVALAMDRFRSTEQRMKSMEETVRERYSANLLRVISRDMRDPLDGMAGKIERLAEMTGEGDPRRELAQSIREDAQWLHSLLENILNLTRLQDGALPIHKKLESMQEVIGNAASHIAAYAPDREISMDMPPNLPLVPMDAKLVGQIVTNLLDNAVKHSKPGQEISLAAEICENQKMAKITVRDRGAGIRKKDLPNIFKVFYTSHAKNADARQGKGLGLAICEAIVKAHGGKIEARNRTDGPGAEFSFLLPMDGMDGDE